MLTAVGTETGSTALRAPHPLEGLQGSVWQTPATGPLDGPASDSAGMQSSHCPRAEHSPSRRPRLCKGPLHAAPCHERKKSCRRWGFPEVGPHQGEALAKMGQWQSPAEALRPVGSEGVTRNLENKRGSFLRHWVKVRLLLVLINSLLVPRNPAQPSRVLPCPTCHLHIGGSRHVWNESTNT